MDPHFHRLMNTYNYEDALFRIDPRLRTLRELKEKYIYFNSCNAGQPLKASDELEDIIDYYYQSDDRIFVDFATLLSKYKEPIINSFVMTEKNGPGGLYNSRLSNGPIESLNRKVKDLMKTTMMSTTKAITKMMKIAIKEETKKKINPKAIQWLP